MNDHAELLRADAPSAAAESSDELDRLAKALEKIAREPGASLTVYDLGPTGEKGNLFRIAAADVDADDLVETIRRQHGPGHYEVWGKVKYIIKFREKVRIGAVSDMPRLRALGSSGTAPQQPASTGDGNAFSVIAEALTQQTKMLERLLTRESNREQPSTLEMLKEFAAMRDLLSPPSTAPTQSAIQQFKDLLELRTLLRDGEPAEDALSAGIRTLGPIFTRALEHMKPESGGEPGGRMARVRAALTQQQPAAEAAAEQPEMLAQMMLRQYVPDLLQRATAGEHPSATAAAVAETLSTLPDTVTESILVWLDADDAVQKIAQLVPAAGAHAVWLDAVLDELFALFASDDDPPPADVADVPRGTIMEETRAGTGAQPASPAPPAAAAAAGDSVAEPHSVNSGRNRRAPRAPKTTAGASGIPT